jgi:hypothetical protein
MNQTQTQQRKGPLQVETAGMFAPFVRTWESLLEKKKAYQAKYLAEQEHARLIKEVRDAQQEWFEARQQLNLVSGSDQVDCAIYGFEAAQKRYEMLLRQAKGLKLIATDIYFPRQRVI